MLRPLLQLAVISAGILVVNAHGSHGQAGVDSSDWATMHMASEHHIDNFDPSSFFSLHDFNSDGVWTADEVRRLYGLNDESNNNVAQEIKDNAVNEVFSIFDLEKTGQITRNLWLHLIGKGRRLPDFGLGPGHHGDDEYEYEIHHFEKFHDENTKVEDLIHAEDIAHFKKHDHMEDEAERTEKLERMQIVEANIPSKFRKQQ